MPLVKGKDLKLYISTSYSTIASMLVQEDENDIKCAIYYLNQILSNTETRYSPIERLFFVLYKTF